MRTLQWQTNKNKLHYFGGGSATLKQRSGYFVRPSFVYLESLALASHENERSPPRRILSSKIYISTFFFAIGTAEDVGTVRHILFPSTQ